MRRGKVGNSGSSLIAPINSQPAGVEVFLGWTSYRFQLAALAYIVCCAPIAAIAPRRTIPLMLVEKWISE